GCVSVWCASRARGREHHRLPPPAGQYQPPRNGYGPGHVTAGSCGACSSGQYESDCGGRGKGDRWSRLIDFLLYRPLPGCDCCPQTTQYVPPLHAWFPPECHANGGNGCATGCNKCGLKKKGGRGDCASCGATAGMPMRFADTKPVLVDRTAVMPTRPFSHGIPTVTVRPQPPMAGPTDPSTRYWMPGVSTGSERSTPYSPSATTRSNDG